jgi:hypothetical protein
MAHTFGAIIRRYGWFIQDVGGSELCTLPGCRCSEDEDGVPFAYTVGLFGLNHAELLIFGVPQETAGGVLNDKAAQIRAGQYLLRGKLITFEPWPHRVIPEEVPNPGEIVYAANRSITAQRSFQCRVAAQL